MSRLSGKPKHAYISLEIPTECKTYTKCQEVYRIMTDIDEKLKQNGTNIFKMSRHNN